MIQSKLLKHISKPNIFYKKAHSKIAAVLSAAVLAVSGASALNASAVSLSPISQDILLHEPSAMSMYLHGECGLRFLNGNYWNTGDVNTCSTSAGGTTTYISAGQVRGSDYSTNYCGSHSGALSGTAGFARKLAFDYFGTDHYIHLGGAGKNFKARVGDQIAIGTVDRNGNYNIAQVDFVTKVTGTQIEFAYADKNDSFKIHWFETAWINNGAYVDEDGNILHILYVERPMQAGDVNGDTKVDYQDYISAIKVANNTYSYASNVDRQFVRAAANVNCDGIVNGTDYGIILSNFSGGVLNNYGFVTSV